MEKQQFMQQSIVFATNNSNKIKEIRQVAGDNLEILSLDDIGFVGEIPEDFDTLSENALQKARFIHSRTGRDCFADDTGLEVEALNGRPGVKSARYAGPSCSSADNIEKLLSELGDNPNRNARFRTVIALISEGKEFLFEGMVEGEILHEKIGTAGFGYDPVFRPLGFKITFAQMPPEIKNRISHRGIAVKKLMDFFKAQKTSG